MSQQTYETQNLRTPFPTVSELSELRGPIKSSDNIYIRPPSDYITTIWYKFNIEKKEWKWTPYNDYSVWISMSELVVPDGEWKNCKPAAPNVKIIEYLNEYNPIPPQVTHKKNETSINEFHEKETVDQLMNMKFNSVEECIKLLKKLYPSMPFVPELCLDTKHIDEKQIDLDDAVTSLSNLGYNAKESLSAYISCEYNMDKTVEYLKNDNNAIEKQSQTKTSEVNSKQDKNVKSDECDGSVTRCCHLPRLTKAFKVFNLSQSDDAFNMKQLLDDFIHLLYYHNADDQFHYIYESFNQCNIINCDSAARIHTRDGQNIKHSESEVQRSILDKIHCYFMHSYDVGHRLSPIERKKLTKADDQIIIINQKHNNLNKNLDTKSSNKFNQLSNSNRKYQQYSFGNVFYYWEFYKNNQSMTKDGGDAYMLCERYIEPQFTSLKEELLNNSTATLCVEQWNNEYRKASIYLTSTHCKSLIADPKPHDWLEYRNTELYKISKGEIITRKHLIAVMVYCNYNVLSYEFSKTFRRNSELSNEVESKLETDESLKKRHSAFHHLAKLITEVVNLFSKTARENNIKSFYHGLNEQMLFDSMSCNMYQPLSTTSSWAVAVSFTDNTGMIVEIHCSPDCRYFDCAWLSDYANEKELLFIYPQRELTFANITNVVTARSYPLYICALSIIDRATNGLYFHDQPNQLSSPTCPIDPKLKLLTVQMIKHQLNKRKPLKYQKCKKIVMDKYVETLFDRICFKKSTITINWQSMNLETLEEKNNSTDVCQGYAFLKHLLCENDYQILNLDVLLTLFPNATRILIHLDTHSISSIFLDYILSHVIAIDNGNKEKNVPRFSITAEIRSDTSIIEALIRNYQQTFFSKNWFIALSPSGKQVNIDRFYDIRHDQTREKLRVLLMPYIST